MVALIELIIIYLSLHRYTAIVLFLKSQGPIIPSPKIILKTVLRPREFLYNLQTEYNEKRKQKPIRIKHCLYYEYM